MLKTLGEISQRLNHANIRWAIGGSLMLYLKNLYNHSNDIDIIVDEKHIEIADKILSSLGTREAKREDASLPYVTTFFYEYKIDGIEVDLMSGLKIKTDSGIYDYIFDNQSITDVVNLKDIPIPLTALEDWFVLYQIMHHGLDKAQLIELHMRYHGIKHPVLLQRSLHEDLPEEVRYHIEALLYSQYPEYKVI